MLIRYWFLLFPDNQFGGKNIGVTAYSKNEAIAIIIESFKKINYQEAISNLTDQTSVIENIDIQLLDQNHVIPNMGVVNHKGVWFPNLQ